MGKMSELEMMVKELRGYGENLIRMDHRRQHRDDRRAVHL